MVWHQGSSNLTSFLASLPLCRDHTCSGKRWKQAYWFSSAKRGHQLWNMRFPEHSKSCLFVINCIKNKFTCDIILKGSQKKKKERKKERKYKNVIMLQGKVKNLNLLNCISLYLHLSVIMMMIISWRSSPLGARVCQTTAGLTSICSQTEVNVIQPL